MREGPRTVARSGALTCVRLLSPRPRPLPAHRQQVLQLLLARLGGHEQQLVTGLQGLLGARRQHPGAADDRDERGVLRPGHGAHPDAGERRLRRQRQLDQVGVAVAEAQQPDEIADAHRLLDQRGHQTRRGDRDVDAPRLVEQPLVLRVVHPGHDPRHAVLGLREQRDDQVDLVVTRRGDHDVAPLERRLVERRDLTGVREEPLGHRDALHRDGGRRLVDQQHLVPVLQELGRDGTAHRTGPGNRDAHQ